MISNNLFILNKILGPNYIMPYERYASSTEATSSSYRAVVVGSQISNTASKNEIFIRSRAVRKVIL